MVVSDVLRRAERRIGTTLCRKWHLDSVLGVGTFGTVYAATHRNRSRVAIKVLHPELSVDEQVRSRFMRECYVSNTIGHPGVVGVIDDDEAEDGSAFVVMELLSGESVLHRMARHEGRLPLPEALWIADQLLDVLAAAHDKGVWHRDIKPDNLFVASNGRLKVFDFGISQLRPSASGATRTGVFLGTPGYVSPEQARARSEEVDGRSDLYSVGAMLFSMVAGHPVHRAESSTEALALTISVPATSVAQVEPNLPPGVVELIDKALRYRREERWPDARSMQEATRRASGEPPKEAHTPLISVLQPVEVVPQQVARMEPLPQPTTMGGKRLKKGLLGRLARLRLAGKVGGLLVATVTIAAATALAIRVARNHSAQPPAAASDDIAAHSDATDHSLQGDRPLPKADARKTPESPPHLTALRALRTTPPTASAGALSATAPKATGGTRAPHTATPNTP